MKKDAQKNVIFRGLFFAFAFVGAATVIGRLFCLLQFPETNIVVVYILSVILTARFTDGYIWGIAATVLSTCAFNIFFTHPYFTLFVDDPTYLITFAIMAMTSVITSALALTLTAGCSLTEAMLEFASALGTVGLTIGLTGTDTNNATLIVEMIGMILGRLEIFIVLTGIYSICTKIKSWK